MYDFINLSEEQKEMLKSLYESGDFATLKTKVFQYGAVKGCSSCTYDFAECLQAIKEQLYEQTRAKV